MSFMKNWFKRMSEPDMITLDLMPCDGCRWMEEHRYQKCSTCRRNTNMKDNYESLCTDAEGGVEGE